MAEVAAEEMLGGGAAGGGMVAGDARDAHVGPLEGEIDHGNAPAAKLAHVFHRLLVRAQRHERAVARPAARQARETVLDHQVPSVRAREAGDALQSRRIGGGDEEEDAALPHGSP